MEGLRLVRVENLKAIFINTMKKEIITPAYITFDHSRGLNLNGMPISYETINKLIENEEIEMIFESDEDRLRFGYLYTLFLVLIKRLKPENVNKHIEKYKSLIINF